MAPLCSCCGQPMQFVGIVNGGPYWRCNCNKPWIDPLKRKKEQKGKS